jgi:hypothetical protein
MYIAVDKIYQNFFLPADPTSKSNVLIWEFFNLLAVFATALMSWATARPRRSPLD